MKTFIDRLLRNSITFEITAIFVYMFYCIVFAVSMFPSFILIRWGTDLLNDTYLMLFVFATICTLSLYMFLIVSTVVVGTIERLLTIGIKPGSYSPGSVTFFRWLTYSGLHLWFVIIVLTFLRGTNWIKIYMRIAGAKVGRETFINAKDIYDTYLIELGNEVMIGGDAFLNCHLYENGFLNLRKIIIEDGATIGAHSYLTPGTRIGKNATVGMCTYLRRNTTVRDGETLMTPPGMGRRQVIRMMRHKGKEEQKV